MTSGCLSEWVRTGRDAVKGRVLPFAWYRFRATFRHRWGSLLSVVLLSGLLGGLSMAAIADARSTESSATDLVASTHTPNLFVLDGFYNPAIGLKSGYNAALLRKISHIPHVKRVETEVGLNAGPITKNGAPLPAAEGIGANGSVNGLDFNEDQVIVTQGRMANPKKVNEFVLDSATAKAFGLHLGESVRIGWASNASGASEGGPGKVLKDHTTRMKLVGVGAIQATNLFQDQDSANNQIELFTPAFTKKILNCCSNDMLSALTLQGGSKYQSAVESAIRRDLPKGFPFTFVQASDVEATAGRTLKPESIALGVFGGIAGLAALLIAGQVIGRRIRINSDELNVLRALGADPAMIISDGLIGNLGSVLVGTVLAGLVAIGLSPLAPLGPVREFLPVEVRIDWTVVGLGMALLLVSLGALATGLAYRAAPHRVAARIEREKGSGVARIAVATGLPPSAVTGIRFALEPGVGRSAVPVRSAILGAVLAVVVVVSTTTFGASMNTLVSHPVLYGWNWSVELNGGGGLGDIPGPPVAALLNADRYVAGWSGVYFSTLKIDGQNLPVLGGSPNTSVGPPLLSGHAFDGSNQVVLGAATLAQLHKRLGETVQVQGSGSAPTTLTIVGTATMPSIGVAGSSHLEMGTGALLSYKLIPPGARNVFDVPARGPNAILVRLKKGANSKAGVASLEAIVRKFPQFQDDGGEILPVERPAEILNYRTLGATPTLLGVALAAGAVVALGLTLVTSVRRRRTDLALLKTLGFTKRQLAAAIAWQATVAVTIGCVIGIPLGIALGRFLWDLFVHQINAVPDPTIPALSIVLIAVAAIILANLVAAVPGQIAARTPTAQLLRSE
jgi:ABC-type antimicrobial peptide transport system permease subunit